MAFTKLNSFSKKPSDMPDVPSPAMTPDDIRSLWETPSDELMATLNINVDKLNSTTDGDSGANNIGATGFDGTASNPQAMLEDLNTRKAENGGDWAGTWQGYTPSKADPGISSVVDDLKNTRANAINPIFINTYDGSNQPMHPKVLYFDTAWNGYKYWMAYTPYPGSNDDFENPCISASNDGVVWVTPSGLVNPLAQPTAQQITDGGHYSDTHLLYRSDTGVLECWYRYNVNNVTEQILRRTTTDGITWTAQETMWSFSGVSQALSPVVMYENGKYKLWYVSYSDVMYLESTDGVTWSTAVKTNVRSKLPSPYYVWHIDIVETDLGYEMLASVYKNGELNSNNKILMYGVSSDGITFGDFDTCILASTNKKAFDSNQIYRSTFVKINGFYQVYYSAMNSNNNWGIGISIGPTLDRLVGTYLGRETTTGDFQVKRDLLLGAGNEIEIGNGGLRQNKVTLVESGISSSIVRSSKTRANTAEVMTGDEALPGDINLGRLISQGVNGVKANLAVTDTSNQINVFGGEGNSTGFLRLAGIQFAGGNIAPSNLDDGMLFWFSTEKKLKVYQKTPSMWFSLQVTRTGTTASRPTTNLETGMFYFDTTLNKPIWRNTANSGWVDAMGTTV